MRRFRFIVVLLCAMMAVVGCHRRPLLEPDHRAVLKVKVRYDGIKNVTTGIYNDKIAVPEFHTDVLRVLFYNEAGSRILSEGFITEREVDADGNDIVTGNVMLAPGHYRVLAYNFDTPGTFIRNEHRWESITAFTDEIPESKYRSLRGRAIDNEYIYYEPDHLFVARDADLYVEAHSDTKVIEMEANTIIDTYYVQIRVKNLEYAASATAVLSGLSSTNAIGANTRHDDESTALYIEMQKSTDERIEDDNKDVLCGVFNTFGRIEGVPSDLHITFQALTREGEYAEKTIDMTPVFLSEDARERHWLLIDEVWELPVPINPPGSGGGGFSPEVDDWEDEEVIVPIS